MQALLEFVLQRSLEYWHKPRWGAAVAIIGALLALVLVTKTGATPPTAWGWVIVASVTVAVTGFWFATNKLPRVPQGRVGVVLAVTCDDDRHDQQVRADFIKTLKRLLERDPEGANFFVITLPTHLAKHIGGEADAGRYLRRLRAHMILFGTVRKRQLRGQPVHVLNFDGLVRHAPATEPVRKELSSQFESVVPRRWILPTDADFFAFEATSQWTDVAARYIIGLAALVSGDVEYAERLLLEVESQIRVGRPALPPLRAVGQKLPTYFGALYTNWHRYLVDRYTTSRDESLLPKLEEIADKLLKRVPGDLAAHLAKSMCHFLLRRDIPSAIHSAYDARTDADVTWKYNIAFLEAYQGNFRNADAEYAEAFRGPLLNVTVPVQCEEFIQLVLNKEPERFQLHYYSGLINFHAKKDMSGAIVDLGRFLASASGSTMSRQVTSARELLARAEAAA